MRLARLLFVGPFVLLWGCAETPECVDFDGDGEYTLDCSAGKVPACGEEPELLYSPATGALLPLPPEGETCEGFDRCRPRPTCQEQTVTCPDGLPPRCVLGTETELDPPRPMPDSGPPPDAGPSDEDAGPLDEDAGTEEDAGTAADAGSEEDAGAADAG